MTRYRDNNPGFDSKTTLHKTICDAIRSKTILTFMYRNYRRVVQPYALGISKAGNECLRCYQIEGTSDSGEVPGWKMMRTSEISYLCTSEKNFPTARPEYKRGDSGMLTIFCEL